MLELVAMTCELALLPKSCSGIFMLSGNAAAAVASWNVDTAQSRKERDAPSPSSSKGEEAFLSDRSEIGSRRPLL